jgi:DNA polymerase elongation subunit (family B)
LLKSFVKKYKEISPTIITGWNTDYFDVPYLIHRLNVIFGETTANILSPIGIISYNKFQGKYKIGCVSSLDYLLLYKRFSGTNEPNYRLDSIGRKEVNMGKIEYEGTLDKLLENDINKFIEYNLNDVKIIKALDEKLQFIDLARSICHVGHVSYEDFHVSSRFLEGAILAYLKKNHLIAPNKPVGGRESYEQKLEDDEEGYSGAYVKDPIPGKYEWIFDLDLTSLYPSIIMSLNISPETKISVIKNWNAESYIKNNLPTIQFRDDYSMPDMSIDEFKKFLIDKNYSVSSNGVLYSQPKKHVVGKIKEWKDSTHL